MTDQKELRDDVPPEPDDERRQMGDRPEEGRDDDKQGTGFENEPSPHQGEQGQESES